MELDDAANYAKSQDIRLYIINISPALANHQYAPQHRQLQAVAESTGGRFYLTNNAQELQDIYTTIDQLEKGSIFEKSYSQINTVDPCDRRFSLYPFFIFLGLVCFSLSHFFDLSILRRIP